MAAVDAEVAAAGGATARVHDELREALLGGIDELLDELKSVHKNISDQALEHIHANEVIMTHGKSRTVEAFLKAAARKRKFKVIVAETAPGLEGHATAQLLAEAGIDTTLIPDDNVFAMMARCNKVIVSTHAVMADGGLVAKNGTHLLALAAKTHSVPFVAITGLYKLTPTFERTQVPLASPADVLPFEEVDELENVHVDNPALDYVPAELVSLLLTNFGSYNPSYIYRLLREWYDIDDLGL